jgi:hypothetical protein
LAFYERAKRSFLANAFTVAYQKSAARYGDLMSHINEGGLLALSQLKFSSALNQ